MRRLLAVPVCVVLAWLAFPTSLLGASLAEYSVEAEPRHSEAFEILPMWARPLLDRLGMSRFEVRFHIVNRAEFALGRVFVGFEIRSAKGHTRGGGGFEVQAALLPGKSGELAQVVEGLELLPGDTVHLSYWEMPSACTEAGPPAQEDLCVVYCDRCYARSETLCGTRLDFVECTCSPSRCTIKCYPPPV